MKAATSPRSIAVLALLLLLVVWPRAAAAQVALTDADARARLEAMQAEGVLRDPFWAHAYWSRSRVAPTEAARVADLRGAIRFDPEASGTRWELCGLLLREHDRDFLPTFVETLSHEARSFAAQRRFAMGLLTVGVGAALVAMLVLSVLAVAKTLPRLRHALIERLHFLPPELRGPAAILTIAAPFALSLTLPPTAAVFWGTLYGTIAAWALLDRWERRTCVTTLAAFLVAPAALILWTRLALPALPTSYLNALWEAQSSADVRAGSFLEQASPPGAHGDPDWFASLALADRRAGRLEDARRRLERAIEIEPREWSYVNNLGNVRLLAGDTDGALEAYRNARTLAPREPLIRVNEAQAWVRKLEFNRADEALAAATSLGYRLPPVLGSEGDRVLVRDRVLDASAVWRRLARGQGVEHALGVKRAAAMTVGVLFPFRPFWLSLPLFLAAWWVAFARHLPRVTLCATCGAPVCRKCHYRVLRRSLCAECHSIRRDVKAPLKRQELLDARRRKVLRVPRTVTLLLAVLLPGSGHLLRGAPRRATTLLVAALAVALIGGASGPQVSRFAPGPASGGDFPFALAAWLFLAAVSVVGAARLPDARPATELLEGPVRPRRDP